MRLLRLVLLTATVTAGSALPALAQSFSDEATWGVQGGFGIGYGTVTEGTTRKLEPTYNVGVFAAVPFAGSFRFQPEVKFDHREITIGGITTAANYLSFPLLFRSDFLGIFMSQGVALNFPMSVSIFDVDFKDAITSPDVAIVLGVGKTIGKVSIEGRWDTGLRSFQKGIDAGGVKLRAITGVVSIHLK